MAAWIISVVIGAAPGVCGTELATLLYSTELREEIKGLVRQFRSPAPRLGKAAENFDTVLQGTNSALHPWSDFIMATP